MAAADCPLNLPNESKEILANILREVVDIPGFPSHNPDLLQWLGRLVDVPSIISAASVTFKVLHLIGIVSPPFSLVLGIVTPAGMGVGELV